MSENTIIPDQEDILAINQRLEADNTRLTGELKASTELLEMSQEDLTTATQRASQLSERVNVLEIAAKVAGEELTRLKADNVALTARMADFNKAVAAEVSKLGLNPKAADHQEPPADTDLTPTQRVLAVKGVNTIADLNRK
jgi:predicted  nucleic acid-binding Zn-ribbon protein